MALGADTHTRIPTRGPKQFQETRRAWPSATRAWFKNLENFQHKFQLQERLDKVRYY